MGLIRNQVYGSPVPWVRIPPSPPENKKAPLRGLFVFRPSVVEDKNPVRAGQRRSRLRRRVAAIPPSPPENKKAPLRGLFVFSPSEVWAFEPRSTGAAAQRHARARSAHPTLSVSHAELCLLADHAIVRVAPTPVGPLCRIPVRNNTGGLQVFTKARMRPELGE